MSSFGRMSRRVMPMLALVLLAATACADADENGAGGADGGGTVDVTLQEWAVVPAQHSAQAGGVTFAVMNEGPDHPHELVIIRTELGADALPTTHEGGVDEDGQGIEVIGEIEEFAPGETREATFDFEPGRYVLVCNVVAVAGEHGAGHGEEGEMEGEAGMGEMEVHYQLGMRAPFTVVA